jgi:hypothetical protein
MPSLLYSAGNLSIFTLYLQLSSSPSFPINFPSQPGVPPAGPRAGWTVSTAAHHTTTPKEYLTAGSRPAPGSLVQQVASSAQRPIQHFPLRSRPSRCLALVPDRGRRSGVVDVWGRGWQMLPQHSARREVESAEPCWMALSLCVARRFPEWLLRAADGPSRGLGSECNPNFRDQSCPSKQGRGLRLEPAELETTVLITAYTVRCLGGRKYCVHATRQ